MLVILHLFGHLKVQDYEHKTVLFFNMNYEVQNVLNNVHLINEWICWLDNDDFFKTKSRLFIFIFVQINLGQLPPALAIALIN